MVENEDLELSLSLGCPKNGSTASSFSRSLYHPHPHPLQLNLISSSLASSSVSPFLPNHPFTSVAPPKTPWIHSFRSDRTSEAPICAEFSMGIDVNRSSSEEDEAGVSSPKARWIHSFRSSDRTSGAPICAEFSMATEDPRSSEEDEAGVSSPISTISSTSGKRSEREARIGAGDDHDTLRGISDEEDGETSRKKLRLTKQQSAYLEESFKEHNTLNPKEKLDLANRLGLRTRQVEVWFQNRRARTKLKQTEVDCELLRRCCEQLTEENKRLQKEVQELRSLKMSPQIYMQMKPPTTLTMCPSCERVGALESGAR